MSKKILLQRARNSKGQFVPIFDHKKAYRLLKSGYSEYEVARTFGVTQVAIHYVKKKMQAKEHPEVLREEK